MFDSIQKNTLIGNLKNVLNHDELHLIQILLDMKIAAKCGNYKNLFFSMGTGASQGDFSSTIEFTFYQAKSFETSLANDTSFLDKHNTKQSNSPIVPQNYQIDIEQQYADDISKISTTISAVEKMKNEQPLVQRKD